MQGLDHGERYVFLPFKNSRVSVPFSWLSHETDSLSRYFALSQVEEKLESALVSMFERTDPMKAWELKKMSNAAWQDAFRS